MNLALLESRLTLSFGKTLTALVRLAHELNPKAPHQAFWNLDLQLPWIAIRGGSAAKLRVPGLTPRNVLPFATDGDKQPRTHYGFLDDGSKSAADARPVVRVRKEWPPAEVVAPDLPTFLGLVAYAGALNIARASGPEAWKKARELYLEEDGEVDYPRRRGFEKAGERLCTLPGVKFPAKPWKVGMATLNAELLYDRPPRLEELLSPKDALTRASAEVEHGNFTVALELATFVAAQRDERFTVLGELLVVQALEGIDRTRAAVAVEALATKWLGGQPQFVHPAQWDALVGHIKRAGPAVKPGLLGKIGAARKVAAEDSF